MMDTIENIDEPDTTASEVDTSVDTADAGAPADGTVDTEAPEADTTDPADTADQAESPSRREARYRRQLREAEAERDQLAAQLDALRRAEVERIAADHLTKPQALWTAGAELNDLLDDSGLVDAERVRAAATQAREELGLESPRERKMRGLVVPGEGTTVRTSSSSSSSWSDAFKID
jgi:hypothetical protein